VVRSDRPFHMLATNARFYRGGRSPRIECLSRMGAGMTRDELLARLARLRQARVGQIRVPHKPLLLVWLFGQFAATGSSVASYQQAEEPVSQLINDFGPPVASPAAARQRARDAVRSPGARVVGSAGRGRKGNRAGRSRTPRLVAGAGSGRPPARSGGTAPVRPGNAGGGRPAAPGPALHPGPGRVDLRRSRP
jgi:hypothetical protein